MADEIHPRVLLEHLVEALEPVVVHLELPVHQHRHAIGLRELVDPLHLRSVAVDAKLLFGDDDGATLQIRSISLVAPSTSGTSFAPNRYALACARANW